MNSELKTIPTTSDQPKAGAGMDKKIERKTPIWTNKFVVAALLIAVIAIAYNSFDMRSGRALAINGEHIVINEVKIGTFEDFIPVRGRVAPAKTVYLDAIEGGRVEKVYIEDGTTLAAGDLIVKLSNTSLQLSVLGNEARVAEQLNNMRSIELNLEQNKLRHKSNIIDIEYQIKRLTRQLKREQTLLPTGAIQQSQVDDTLDSLEWYKNRLSITKESQASDIKMQEAQLAFLKETGARLESNLELSRKSLENMDVRAPVAGQLSGFNIEVGQSIGRGERLGQLDTPNDYKVTAFIDEFYLNRVDIGQKATFGDYQLAIKKIYPQVQNGQFEVDLAFQGEQPDSIRRGQSVQTKLTLGDASQAKLIANGAFYQDTRGSWVFVINQDGSEAVRRNVKLGRRNNQFIEVLSGLEVGEQVITSPYSSYLDMQRLKLKN